MSANCKSNSDWFKQERELGDQAVGEAGSTCNQRGFIRVSGDFLVFHLFSIRV